MFGDSQQCELLAARITQILSEAYSLWALHLLHIAVDSLWFRKVHSPQVLREAVFAGLISHYLIKIIRAICLGFFDPS